jgi:hypothetical protein
MSRPDWFQLLAYEEALGYALGPTCRDKDGLLAALAVCDLCARLLRTGSDPLAVLDRLALDHGVHTTSQIAVRFEPSAWPERRRQLMERLEDDPPTMLGGRRVEQVDRPADDLVRLFLVGGDRLAFRPSGTEPKFKAYLGWSSGGGRFASGGTVPGRPATSRTRLEWMEHEVRSRGRGGPVELDEAAMNGPASPGTLAPTGVERRCVAAIGQQVESTKLMIDRAMGGDRHDRQLTTALLAVMVALLILIPLGRRPGAHRPRSLPRRVGGRRAHRGHTAADGRPGSCAGDQQAAGGSDTVIELKPNTTYRLTTGCTRRGVQPDDDAGGGVLELGEAGGLYLKGNGATVRQECAGQRVLHATGDDRLHLSEVTLSGGQAKSSLGHGSGGALLSEGGTVTIEDSMLTSNQAEDSAVPLR